MKPNILKLFVLLLGILNIAEAQQKNSKQVVGYSTAALKKAVEANPESLDAHHAYLGTVSLDTAAKQYAIWMKRFPKSSMVCFALGESYYNQEQGLKGQPYLAMAVKLDSKLALAWKMMAKTANDYDAGWAQKYAANAVALEPGNPDYAYTYAYSFKNTDSLKYDSLMLTVANRFTHTELSIVALHRLIVQTKDWDKKEEYYKIMLNNPPARLSAYFDMQIIEYYDSLLLHDMAQAAKLAKQMSEDKKHAERLNDWRDRYTFATNFATAKSLAAANKPDSALIMLDSIKIDRASPLYKTYVSLKAGINDATNHTAYAYNNLLHDYSQLPTDEVRDALITYGLKLGYNEDQVMNDVWKIRDSAAVIATDFKLKGYLNNDSVSLANYRGKVILLTYWFPACGSCRVEFPNFENVIKNVNNQNLIYLGLNVEPSLTREVLQLIKTNGYTFIPVHDSQDRKKGNLKANGEPTNYLIDQQGRIVFSNFRIDETNVRTLELMITELLNRKPKLDLPQERLDTVTFLPLKH